MPQACTVDGMEKTVPLDRTKSGKRIEVVHQPNLYRWSKSFRRVQEKFFPEEVKIRRIAAIEDFVRLNGYRKVYHVQDVDLALNLPEEWFVPKSSEADLVLLTALPISRWPCDKLVSAVHRYSETADVYLCLNRNYLNITNQRIDLVLPDDYQEAIASWLKQSLPDRTVVDLSKDFVDTGTQFSWAIPDRCFFVS